MFLLFCSMRVLFTVIVLACARILSASAPAFTILDASSFQPITATLILPSGESIELKKGWTKPADFKTGLYTIKSAGFKSISFSLEKNALLPERIRIWLDPANARPASSGLVVLDQQSGLPVKGIKVKDLANGYLLTAKGYRSLHFSPSYRIAETLYLIEMQAGRGRQQIREVHGLDFEPNGLLAGPAAGARGASCTPPATIRVGTNCNCTQCTQVEVMSLETYTAQGLNDEWIPSWNSESLKAGSVAYRSFGAWYVINQALPGVNYDIASSTCNQVWTPSLSAACASAAAATAGELLEQNAAIARSEYSAEANFETGCANGQKGDGSAQWPCSSDSLCAGNANSGHGRGMCQWGSQRWASQRAWTYTQILDHYYNIGGLYRCGTAPLPARLLLLRRSLLQAVAALPDLPLKPICSGAETARGMFSTCASANALMAQVISFGATVAVRGSVILCRLYRRATYTAGISLLPRPAEMPTAPAEAATHFISIFRRSLPLAIQ